ncbi:transketolase [Citrobacter portucalensis]|uniref:transketolase n=1 Tax=Citrobacter portucalensis TaxID=1639133 RepID=UPI0025975613|nr:transketolase [uncultured Citrobacter sp.]
MLTPSLSRRELANAIRILSIDAIQKAKSGHPGAPMGMADMAEVLWRSFLKHNPTNPNWVDRDRFVLSNGHASMLLYSLLHLTGYDLTLEDIKQFRQLDSRTPGHPEYEHVGVETTTGPLGQGIANAVGMAIAEKTLAAQFNRPGHTIVDHYTYVFAGDGCLMEGISHEACSLAGTLQLGKLIVFYDDNGISIDGDVGGWFTDNTAERFSAYKWHVIGDIDGHDASAIERALEQARSVTDKPSMLICKTTIGFGAPNKAGSHDCHGAPLGESEVAATRHQLDWPHAAFDIPQDYYSEWDCKAKGHEMQTQWDTDFAAYGQAYPELAAEFERRIGGELPANWQRITQSLIDGYQVNPVNTSTRQASQDCIEAFACQLTEIMGGSADLAPSNLTLWSGSREIVAHPNGNYIHYGVREFGMSAIMNGISLHGGFIPYGATFLMFMEYARNALRMAALMKLRTLFVYTHDSIGIGEDGPTHQPVEQIATIRLIPNMSIWRPCDQLETAIAWQCAIARTDGPSTLVFSRQKTLQQVRTSEQVANIYRGGYILKDCSNCLPELIIIATGSEVELAVAAWQSLVEAGKRVRVVSMPSTDRFDQQDEVYRESVLPSSVTKRIAVEAGIPDYWYKYVGLQGKVIGMVDYGKSAPAEDLFKEFGFTVKNVVEIACGL